MVLLEKESIANGNLNLPQGIGPEPKILSCSSSSCRSHTRSGHSPVATALLPGKDAGDLYQTDPPFCATLGWLVPTRHSSCLTSG